MRKMRKMTLKEAKYLFAKNHEEESKYLMGVPMVPPNREHRRMAECVWYGFKSALQLTNQLED